MKRRLAKWLLPTFFLGMGLVLAGMLLWVQPTPKLANTPEQATTQPGVITSTQPVTRLALSGDPGSSALGTDLIQQRPHTQSTVTTTNVSNLPPMTNTLVAPVLKLTIRADGLYRLTYPELLGAGFDAARYDSHTLKLYNRGVEIPIYVIGEQDGLFDPGDMILFYGKAINDPYTTQNVYWLSVGGAVGKRMAVRSGAPIGQAPIPEQFFKTIHAEENTLYWQNMPGSDEDRWFWEPRLSPATQGLPAMHSYPIVLPHPATKATATVRVRLKGYSALAHHTLIYFNDQEIDDQAWQGQVEFTHVITISQALLRNGKNVLLVKTSKTNAVVEQILVNWIEVDYWHTAVVEHDQLWLRTPANERVQLDVNSLTEPEVMILDVTSATTPVRLTNATVVVEGARYKVSFETGTRQAGQYFVSTLARAQAPASLVMDQPSAWRLPHHGADYIIITSTDFYTSALALAEFRRASGLRVATVKVDDLYDEFAHGIFDPGAIRDFLRYAYQHWQSPAPTYVVLLGDATQDYKDNLKTGTVNYVPSHSFHSNLFGEVSSDSWFATVGDVDALPVMQIGRLVAQSPQEAETMVAKIIHYEQNLSNGDWRKNALLVADRDTQFEQITEELAMLLPADYRLQRIYASHYPPGDPRADIVDAINQGVGLVTYVGHGQYAGWGLSGESEGYLFDVASVAALHNEDRLPFVVVGNCLNGFFAGSWADPALAEVLQRQEKGGAIAVWAPSSLGYPTDHAAVLRAFYQAFFQADQQTIGSVIKAAMSASLSQSQTRRELLETYVLFGDPATKLQR